MTLAELITNVPSATSISDMNDWFADVKVWAEEEKQRDILTDARAGLLFGDNTEQISKYRQMVLSQLKALYVPIS